MRNPGVTIPAGILPLAGFLKRGLTPRRRQSQGSGTEQPPLPRSAAVPSDWQDLGILAALLLVGFAVRFPFFFPAVIHWDESTFILVGQSILDGHVPYTQAWDLKPPLLSGFFAAVIGVFGKHLMGIRVAGMACVVMAGWLVYLTATRVWNRRTGIVAAILSILAASLIQGGQATMSEHVALLPLVGAMYVLLRRDLSVPGLFLAGALLAMATLVRLNLAYVVVLVGLYVLVVGVSRSRALAAKYIAAYSVGGVLVAAMTAAPYLLTGKMDLLWRSLIVAPLSYASSQSSVAGAVFRQTTHAFGVYGRGEIHIPWLTGLMWLGGAIGVVVGAFRWRHQTATERGGFMVVALFAIGTAVGIAKGGAIPEHYMIQLVPFAALFGASLIDRAPRNLRVATLALTGVAAAVSLRPVLAEYRTIGARLMAHEALRHGDEYEIASYLESEGAAGRPMYLVRDQIVYWFLGSFPPTRLTTHPSNIAKPVLLETVVGKGASTEGELSKVFMTNPEFVVTQEGVWYLRGRPKRMLDRILADRYVLVKEIEGREVFRRKRG